MQYFGNRNNIHILMIMNCEKQVICIIALLMLENLLFKNLIK